MSDPNNLEGPPPTAEERAAMARELDAVAPNLKDKIALMTGGLRPRTDCAMLIGGPVTPLDKAAARVQSLERELAEAREQRDRLAEAARAVVARWETPLWKEAPHTGLFIRALADALDALNVEMEARQ